MSYTPPPPAASAVLGTDQSTTSTTFVDLLSVSVTMGAGYLLATVSVAWSALSEAGALRLVVDGVLCGGLDASLGNGSGAVTARQQVTAGTHTVKLQWRTGTLGTLRVRPQTQADTEHASLVAMQS